MAILLSPVPAVASDPRDPLAAYIVARAADADGQTVLAAENYALVLAAAPDADRVAVRAYRQAIEAGDIDLVRRSIMTMEKSDVAPADVAIFHFADAIGAGDYAGADRAIARMKKGPLDFLAAPLSAWVAYGRGNDPFPLLEAPEGNTLARRYVAESRALLLIAHDRRDEARAALTTIEGGQINLPLRIAAARFYAGGGRRGEVDALLPGRDPAVRRLRSEIKRAAAPTAADGVARLYSRLSTDVGSEATLPLALLLARSAAMIAPQDDALRIQLAGMLGRSGATERAIELVRAIDPKAAHAGMARVAELSILTTGERKNEALALARTLADARGAGGGDAQRLGDLLSEAGEHADAARAYALAIERSAGQAGWMLYLQHGGALERAGEWEAALPLLERAVELAPDQPHALNYLGYAQAERGENLDAAKALLEKAFKLAPDDAAITDSLGWAYYMTGRYDRAVPLLQQAAAAEPADVAINEHLGDALWQVGRRFEARYAWAAAQVYAEGPDAARIGDKIASGIDTPARP